MEDFREFVESQIKRLLWYHRQDLMMIWTRMGILEVVGIDEYGIYYGESQE